MFDKIKKFLEFSAKNGLYLPAAYDKVAKGPSVTLLLVHLSSYVALISIAVLLYNDVIAGTVAALTYSGLMMVFYMLRKLTNAKVDLDDKSFELTNQETKQ